MSGSRILLLDDEPDITSIMSVALKASGFAVDTFNDPIAAISHLEDNFSTSAPGQKYKLVIADIRMRLMSGFEFARRVNDLDRDMKIVLISAFDIKKETFDKMLPGLRIDALLNKPIHMSRLNDVVSTLLADIPRGLAQESSI